MAWEKMNIFELLANKNTCYAVCVGFMDIKGVTQCAVKDYFIVTAIDKCLKSHGFYTPDHGKKNIMIYPLDDEEIRIFKVLSCQLKVVISCHEGRVYELPGNSLKSKMESYGV